MLNIKKSANVVPTDEISLGKCPACLGYVSQVYFMCDQTKRESKWYGCNCGVVWQTRKPFGSPRNELLEGQKLRDVYEYPVHVYAPLIEELLYGRRVLIVNAPNDFQAKALRKRGWVTSSDPIETLPPDTKLNMIWFYHTLETFHDPIAILDKARSLLTEDGILFIAGPDTDFINIRGSVRFIHWKPDDNYLMWNRRSLTKQLDSLGFNVVMSRQNCWQRFPATDDLHMIAQVKFF